MNLKELEDQIIDESKKDELKRLLKDNLKIEIRRGWHQNDLILLFDDEIIGKISIGK